MLTFSDVALRRGPRVLFEHASFTVHAGWKVGVTGANGSGKTSLFALVRGELGADAGEFSRPEKLVLAHVAQETPDSDRPAIEHVLDGDAGLRHIEARLAATDDGVEQGRLHGELDAIGGWSARARAARLLHGLGFAPGEELQPVNTFSGGWRIRLNLAQALMTRSDLLLLDEPTNHLDLDATVWLENWLARYAGTLLVISHDRDFLDGVIDHVVHIEQGRARLLAGNYSAFEERRAMDLAQQQAAHARQQREIAHVQSFVARFKAKASKARQAQSRLKALARMEIIAPAHVDSPFSFSFPPPRRAPRQLLRLADVTAGYGDRAVLAGLEFTLEPGARIALLGRNGAGKSTLVKLLAGAIAPLAGEVFRAPDLAVGYFAQHQLETLRADSTPLAELARLERGTREQELRDYLGGFGFSGPGVEARVATLSGGEKSRLALALIVRQAPQLLLLDEPTNHLDLEMRQAIAMALQDYTGAVVLVTHDRHLLRTVSDDLWLVADGRVAPFEGDLEDYRAWLLARPEPDADAAAADAAPAALHSAAGRRERRQRDAAERSRLRPLRQALAQAEQELERLAAERAAIEARLADPGLYEPARRQDMKAAQLDEGRVRAATAAAEERWLELSAELDRLAAGDAAG